MPLSAKDIGREEFLRALILGPPKVGKSTTIISTAPAPCYVINCDDKSGLKGASRRRSDFEWDLVKDWDGMQAAVATARKGVKEGKYKTVVVDTLSSFAAGLERDCLKATVTGAGNDNPMKAYPLYERKLQHLLSQLFALSCHVICISHYLEIGKEEGLDGGLNKRGEGLAPLLAGKARATVPMVFSDVWFFDYRRGERILIVSPQGAWGPASRNLEGASTLPADIGAVIKAIAAQDAKDAKGRR